MSGCNGMGGSPNSRISGTGQAVFRSSKQLQRMQHTAPIRVVSE